MMISSNQNAKTPWKLNFIVIVTVFKFVSVDCEGLSCKDKIENHFLQNKNLEFSVFSTGATQS